MTEHIPHSLINNILSQTDIVDIIEKRFNLKKKGKNFYAHCPFHQEKNPSFSVSAEKQFYYCFSCGAHGNAIDFLMNYEHLGFLESIEELASIHGINLNKQNSIINKKNTEKQKLYELMNNLSDFYQKNLMKQSAIKARQYLKKRGLNTYVIKYFKIGFALNRWQNIPKKFEVSEKNKILFNQTGTLTTNYQGYTYDRFKERIIFPIRNKQGQVIAFGGRTLGNKIPKYLNSPDTNIFQKRHQLYGLYELQKTCKKPPYILLVEGYMDVISLVQFGIYYVVASLGTSTSITHIQSLYHNTNRIICCYDGDYSGYKAAWRTLKNTIPYLTDTRTLFFIFLPKEEDPDTLIRKIGKNEFLKYIKCAEPLSIFLFKILLKKIDIKTIEGRSTLGYLALPIINQIPGELLRAQLHQELGKKIGIIDEHKLQKLLIKKTIYKKHYYPEHSIINTLIFLLIKKPQLQHLISIKEHKLKTINQKNIAILIELIKFCKNYPNTTPGQILEFYRTKKYYKKIKIFTTWDCNINTNNTIEKTFLETITNLHNLILKERQETLISIARQGTLEQKEREELWTLNKKLATKSLKLIKTFD